MGNCLEYSDLTYENIYLQSKKMKNYIFNKSIKYD